MRRLLRVLALLAVMLLQGTGYGADLTDAELAALLKRAAVRIDVVGHGFGTGFHFGEQVVTNDHVAGRRRLAEIKSRTGKDAAVRIMGTDGAIINQRPGRVDRTSYDKDLASYAVWGSECPFTGLRKADTLREGDELFGIGAESDGFRARGGNLIKLVNDRDHLAELVRDLEGLENLNFPDTKYKQLLLATAMAEPGYSGGPVIDRQGRLAGVMFAVGIDGGVPVVTWIIPAEHVLDAAVHSYQFERRDRASSKGEEAEVEPEAAGTAQAPQEAPAEVFLVARLQDNVTAEEASAFGPLEGLRVRRLTGLSASEVAALREVSAQGSGNTLTWPLRPKEGTPAIRIVPAADGASSLIAIPWSDGAAPPQQVELRAGHARWRCLGDL